MRKWLTPQFGKARLAALDHGPVPAVPGRWRQRAAYAARTFVTSKCPWGLSWYNRNYVGTQFGGSLYSMVDPFYMLMLMENLGRDYIVWDKAASIDFISPGKGPVYAEFFIDEALLDEVRRQTEGGEKYLPAPHGPDS